MLSPPGLLVLGLPFYALGKRLMGGPAGMADPALPVLALLSMLAAAVTAFYGDRLLRHYRITGHERLVGVALLLAFPCLFISSWGIEADIVLTAIMSAFIYYCVRFFERPDGGRQSVSASSPDSRARPSITGCSRRRSSACSRGSVC